MAWPVAEIEALIVKTASPRGGLDADPGPAQRRVHAPHRKPGARDHRTASRRSLIRFSERLGTGNQPVRMDDATDSRNVIAVCRHVTRNRHHYMNRFRSQATSPIPGKASACIATVSGPCSTSLGQTPPFTCPCGLLRSTCCTLLEQKLHLQSAFFSLPPNPTAMCGHSSPTTLCLHLTALRLVAPGDGANRALQRSRI